MLKLISVLIAVLIVAVLVLAGCGNSNTSVTTTPTPVVTTPVIITTPTLIPTPTPTLTPPSPSEPVVTAIEAVLENIYNQVNPSVVNISVTLSGGQGLASGFVWDTGGNIVTNNHVVDGARNISVTFSDGTVVPAQIVGTDPDSDLGVGKVN